MSSVEKNYVLGEATYEFITLAVGAILWSRRVCRREAFQFEETYGSRFQFSDPSLRNYLATELGPARQMLNREEPLKIFLEISYKGCKKVDETFCFDVQKICNDTVIRDSLASLRFEKFFQDVNDNRNMYLLTLPAIPNANKAKFQVSLNPEVPIDAANNIHVNKNYDVLHRVFCHNLKMYIYKVK